MRVLIVEDDKKIAGHIAAGLKQEGYVVDLADNGIDGFHLATTEEYAVVITDIMLPRLTGLELVESVRNQGVRTPILVLSAKNAVQDRVRGLELGADDYLSKPFAFSELVARVQALIRRASSVVEPTTLKAGELTIDMLQRTVTRGSRVIELQPREFSLLAYLVRNKNRIISKTMIMEHVWGYDFDTQTNVVESRMSRLRDKVDAGSERPLIQTVRGAGYVIRAD